MEPARVVDVRGEFCPKPIIETAKAVKQVEVGEVVLILGTDRGIHSELPAWCKANGHELGDMVATDGHIEARGRREHEGGSRGVRTRSEAPARERYDGPEIPLASDSPLVSR